MTSPIREKITGLRQRRRGDGWRIWWEPNSSDRALGFTPVELSESRLTWSKREAERLNREVKIARQTGTKPTRASGDRSMSALILAYRASKQFTSKSERTRAGYTSNLNIIEEKWGRDPVADFSKPIVATWYDTNIEARGDWQAVSLNRTLSILFEFAERKGWRPENSNPARNIRAATPKGRNRRLSWEESDALIKAAHDLGRHAMALAIGMSLYQGQRQTDVRLAKPTDFAWITLAQGNTISRTLVWSFERSKRKNQGAMPIHPEILPDLSQLLLDLPENSPALIIDEATGKPYDHDLISKRFIQIRDYAAKTMPALRDVQFRDLRRTFGGRSRAGGASKDDTADVLGNSAANSFELAEIYMATQFETAARAVDAVKRPQKTEPNDAT
jgi:integrase